MEDKTRRTNSAIPFPWLTLEIALWGLLLALALGLRLLRLDAAPLNAAEARGALAAWRFADGQGAPLGGDYSPALFSGQWFAFLMLGASDQVARLWPALAGAGLVLAPALLRKQLGRWGALIAGFLLALSPTALTLSRTATGDVLAALGALLCAAGLWRWVDRPQHDKTPAMYLLPLGLALVLASSPLAYSALFSLGIALLLLLTETKTRARLLSSWMAFRATPDLARYALGVLAGGLALISTAFAWNMGGLGAAAHLLTEWLQGFVHWPDSPSLLYPLLILFVYEPLILLTGLVGMFLAAQRASRPQDPEHATARFMALWSIAALALALIRPGHGPGDTLLVLVPLACLGGLALDELIRAQRPLGGQRPLGVGGPSSWLNTGLFIAISMPLWFHLLLNLTNYARRSTQYINLNLLSTQIALPTFLSLALLSLVLLLVLLVVGSAAQGAEPTLYDLGVSTLLALLLFTVSAAWNVSQNRPADPREPLVLEPTAPEIRLLTSTLARLSSERHKDDHAIDLSVLSDDPALAWELRNFYQARFIEAAGGALSTSTIITHYSLGTPELGEQGYIGQTIPLRRRWEAGGLNCRWYTPPDQPDPVRQLDCSALVQWLVFRRSPTQPAQEQVVLWLRQDLVTR